MGDQHSRQRTEHLLSAMCTVAPIAAYTQVPSSEYLLYHVGVDGNNVLGARRWARDDPGKDRISYTLSLFRLIHNQRA
jgi:hypothetical protein